MKYIYALSCPIQNVVRYVGSTANPKNRYKQHLKDAFKNRTEKQKWILWLKTENEQPIITILATITDSENEKALEEEFVIKFIDTVYNIHMPDKNHGYVEKFRKTGIKEKGFKIKEVQDA